MQTIDVVYSGGKFTPITPVDFAENERVRLQVMPQPQSEDELCKQIASVKSISEWVDLTKLLPADDGGYDVVAQLRKNRLASGEYVPPKEN